MGDVSLGNGDRLNERIRFIAAECQVIERAMRDKGCSLFGSFDSFVAKRLGSKLAPEDYALWRRERSAEILTARLNIGSDERGGGDGYVSAVLQERRKLYSLGAEDSLLELLGAFLTDPSVYGAYFEAREEWSAVAVAEARNAFPGLAEGKIPENRKLIDLLDEVVTGCGGVWLGRGKGLKPNVPLFMFESGDEMSLVGCVQFMRRAPYGSLCIDWDVYAVGVSNPASCVSDVRLLDGARRLALSAAFADLSLYAPEHFFAGSVARSAQVLSWLCAELSLRSPGSPSEPRGQV